MSEIIVTITATGNRASGKSTVLAIAKKALEEAGFVVSNIQSFGEEVVKEYINVATAKVITRTEWLTRQ